MKAKSQGGLSHLEKLIVCDIAREAYNVWAGRPEFEQRYPTANSFDAWRHGEQAKATGFRSLSHCDARLFPQLKSHFQNLRTAFAAARERAEREETVGQQSFL